MGASASAPALTLAADFQRRLAAFRAADPALQEWCVKVMNGTSRGNAINGADAYIWRHLYARGHDGWPEVGRRDSPFYRGFYVESGANHWKLASNTYFFDKCLGWDGLCIEPNPKYHAGLREHRSCVLVPECLSEARDASLTMWMDDFHSHVRDPRRKNATAARQAWLRHRPSADAGAMRVACNPLDVMLRRVGRSHVDLWCIDIEGFELPVLRTTDWRRGVRVDTVQIESWHQAGPRDHDIEDFLTGPSVGLRRVRDFPGGITRDLLFVRAEGPRH